MIEPFEYFKSDPYPITLKNFPRFIDGSFDCVAVGGCHCLTLGPKQGHGNRGRTTEWDIEELRRYPYIHTVVVTGLQQQTFDFFIRKYGPQLRAIRFLKCEQVEDWSLLGTLSGLEFVVWHGNDYITSLWDMSGNRALQGLAFSGFSALRDVSGIERAPALKYLHIGDAVNPSVTVKSLAPLAETGIRNVVFMGKAVEDDDVSFVSAMPRLETFDFPTHLFTTEQVAWMVANRPDLRGLALADLLPTTKCVYGTDVPAVQIVGKRKPLLVRAGNEARIETYRRQFAELVDRYRDVPWHEITAMR